MKKNLILFVVTLFTSVSLFSQEGIQLKGRISADSLQESSIHIINLTSNKGTVNNFSGDFKIEVRENDVLLFSSVQFKKQEIIITEEILKIGFLEVFLVEDVNELAEVNVSNTTLTGNLSKDIGSIEIVEDLPVGFTGGDFKNARFESDINDPQAAPVNSAFAENTMEVPGGSSVDLIAVAGLVGNLLGGKKKASQNKPVLVTSPSAQIRKLFDDGFFVSSLGIEEERIKDFLFYLDDSGLTEQMLHEKNRLALIDFLIDQSEGYKAAGKAD